MWRWSIIATVLLVYFSNSLSQESKSLNCCDLILNDETIDSLLSCSNTSTASTRVRELIGPLLSVVIVTRATKDIHSYAAYSYFLQQQYSEVNGYELLPLTPDSSRLDYKYYRKIVPMLEAMESRPFADYYVWMDSGNSPFCVIDCNQT